SGTYNGYICPGTDGGNKYPLMDSVAYNGCYNSVSSTRTISTGSSASCGSTSNCSCSGSGSSRKCTESYFAHTWVKNARSTWTGCVMDRGNQSGPASGNYDENVSAPSTTNTATLYAAEQYTLCPAAAIMSLNYNWSAMTSLVNSMSPN